jgi:hypothetical protein
MRDRQENRLIRELRNQLNKSNESISSLLRLKEELCTNLKTQSQMSEEIISGLKLKVSALEDLLRQKVRGIGDRFESPV